MSAFIDSNNINNPLANLREDDEAAASADSNDDDEAMAATVVTNSPVPSEEVGGTSELGTTTSAACANRAAGLVCVCHRCEAARTRLLHRTMNHHHGTSGSSSSAAGGGGDDPPHAALDSGSAVLVTAAHNNNNKRARTTLLESTATSGSTTTPAHTTAKDSVHAPKDPKLAKLTAACRTILECIGEDPDREGLVKTPERWAKALQFMCHGYSMTAQDVTNGAVFSENHDEMVVVRNIDIHSLCEHHMLPFTGHIHIGYIPNGKILGLSKLARIAELYARRLQVQERLTRQICDAVVETIAPLGVAVVVECTHFCMVMRGVQKTGAITTTSSVRGCFETNPKTRAEFFSILHGGKS